MTSDITYDQNASVLRVVLQGVTKPEDLFELVQRLRPLAAGLRPKSVIFDVGGITRMDVDAGAMNSLADVRPVFPAEVYEVVVAPEDHQFGLARMWQTMSAEVRPNIRVARSWDEAYRILGINEPPTFRALEVA